MRIRTISPRSHLKTLAANTCGTLKNPHTIRKEEGTEFPVLWSVFYPSQKHLAWLLCSGIINGHLAAARVAFTCIWLILLSCGLCNAAFGLSAGVVSRHNTNTRQIKTIIYYLFTLPFLLCSILYLRAISKYKPSGANMRSY